MAKPLLIVANLFALLLNGWLLWTYAHHTVVAHSSDNGTTPSVAAKNSALALEVINLKRRIREQVEANARARYEAGQRDPMSQGMSMLMSRQVTDDYRRVLPRLNLDPDRLTQLQRLLGRRNVTTTIRLTLPPGAEDIPGVSSRYTFGPEETEREIRQLLTPAEYETLAAYTRDLPAYKLIDQFNAVTTSAAEFLPDAICEPLVPILQSNPFPTAPGWESSTDERNRYYAAVEVAQARLLAQAATVLSTDQVAALGRYLAGRLQAQRERYRMHELQGQATPPAQ